METMEDVVRAQSLARVLVEFVLHGTLHEVLPVPGVCSVVDARRSFQKVLGWLLHLHRSGRDFPEMLYGESNAPRIRLTEMFKKSEELSLFFEIKGEELRFRPHVSEAARRGMAQLVAELYVTEVRSTVFPPGRARG